MPSLLTLRHAACLLGVSPGRLYRAMADDWVTASPGGGPGKPTLIRLEALQAFGHKEGLRVPEAAEVAERPGRLARAEHSGHSQRTTVLARLQALQADGLSLQAIATQLNAEGVPTLSGTGQWQKGSVGKLLAEAAEV